LPPMMDYNIRHGKTYLYFKGEPLYPFGYGLSYTTFQYSHLKATMADGAVTVSVDVTNTGTRPGDEVVELYVQHLQSKVERPQEELKGFQRVSLEPQQTRTVQIPVRVANLAYWDSKSGSFQVEQEPIRFIIGESARDRKLSTIVQVH
jgi:beta-glucosidase